MGMNFRHRQREEPEINLIPFIDVLLVVLILRPRGILGQAVDDE